MALRLALDCRALEAADYFDIFPGGTKIPAAVLMTGCVANGGCVGPVSASNPLPVAGTFTASLGGFTPSASGARMTPLSVGTSDSSGPLPTGTVVVVSNAGTTNPMFCNVNGLTATVSNQPIPPSSSFGFTIPSGTAAITRPRCCCRKVECSAPAGANTLLRTMSQTRPRTPTQAQNRRSLDRSVGAQHHRPDPRKRTLGGRHQIGIPAGFLGIGGRLHRNPQPSTEAQ
jgi:hypothetical protein